MDRATDTLRLLYRNGVNDGLREALGKQGVGEDYYVAQAAKLLGLAQAIEAQRAETAKTGSVEDESAVPKECAPKVTP